MEAGKGSSEPGRMSLWARPRPGAPRAGSWVIVASACGLGVLCQLSMRWVPGVLNMLTACFVLPMLSAVVGAGGAWHRSWCVTLVAVFAMNAAMYGAAVIENRLFQDIPTKPIVPSRSYVPFLVVGLLVTGSAATIGHCLARAWLARRSPPPGWCAHCGYNLTGNVSGRCPECGTPVPPKGDAGPSGPAGP